MLELRSYKQYGYELHEMWLSQLPLVLYKHPARTTALTDDIYQRDEFQAGPSVKG